LTIGKQAKGNRVVVAVVVVEVVVVVAVVVEEVVVVVVEVDVVGLAQFKLVKSSPDHKLRSSFGNALAIHKGVEILFGDEERELLNEINVNVVAE
jgi:hypothetical protein